VAGAGAAHFTGAGAQAAGAAQVAGAGAAHFAGAGAQAAGAAQEAGSVPQPFLAPQLSLQAFFPHDLLGAQLSQLEGLRHWRW
jgi:hypothetical protein